MTTDDDNTGCYLMVLAPMDCSFYGPFETVHAAELLAMKCRSKGYDAHVLSGQDMDANLEEYGPAPVWPPRLCLEVI